MVFFFSSRRRHTRWTGDWSSDVCSSDLTGEWSQRSGLTTFTLVPHRNRVIAAKAVSSVAVAIASMLFAFVIGAIGNLVCLLTGTMLGMLIRSSAGALVAYFIFSLLVPTVAGILASSQEWFRD